MNPPTGAGATQFHFIIQILLMFVIFYIFLIRPQQKRQRQHEEMVKNLAKNDEVITSGGIHGTVVALKEKSILLRIAEDVKIEVERSAITQVLKSRTGEPTTERS